MIEEFGPDDSIHNYFMLEIRPTTKCNYNCFYCTDLHINSNPIIKHNTANIVCLIEYIKRYTNKHIYIYICGGEPTIYPNLHVFINEISVALDINDKLVIQTNLSRNLSWIKNFLEKIECIDIITIACSYHNTQNVHLFDYIKKCLFLKSKDVLEIIYFSYNSKKCVIQDYEQLQEMVGKKYCELAPLILSSVSQIPAEGNYTGKETEFACEASNFKYGTENGGDSSYFKKNLNYITSNRESKYISHVEAWHTGINNFNGYNCTVSRNKMYIDWDGGCYRCFNEQFSNKPPVFNINHDNFNCDNYFKQLKCMTCPFTTCFFDLDYKKTRQSNITNQEVIIINKTYNEGTN